jgi:hypothetical protein
LELGAPSRRPSHAQERIFLKAVPRFPILAQDSPLFALRTGQQVPACFMRSGNKSEPERVLNDEVIE